MPVPNLKAISSRARPYLDVWKDRSTRVGAESKMLAKWSWHMARRSPSMLGSYAVDSCKFYIHNPGCFKNEVLSGVSIAFMQVPESVAFSFVGGVSPTQGMYSTFFIGLFGGLLTSLPGMVSGIAGAMVAILREVTSNDGPLGDRCYAERVEYAFAVMFVCSIIQLLVGLLQLPRFIKIVPHAVMTGFMNGLSILVFKAQLSAFKVPNDTATQQGLSEDASCPHTDYVPQAHQRWMRLNEALTWQVLSIVFISMAIVKLQPMIKGRLRIGRVSISAKVIPPTLTAMLVTTLLAQLVYRLALDRPVPTIGDLAVFTGKPPRPHIPDVPWGDGFFWSIVGRYSVLLALVGLIESIMTWQLAQRIVQVRLPASYGAFEAISQGVGNLFASLFGSVGGSVMVGQTTINFLNGARGRLSTTLASFIILLFVTVAGDVIQLVPISTLTGILFVVVIETFEWRTFVYLFRLSIPLADVITVILVTVIAVVMNLAIAVLIGVAWSSVVFAWKVSSSTKVSFASDCKQTPPSSSGQDPPQMLELARVNTHPSLARVSAVSIEVFPTRNGSPAAATPPSSCEKLPDIVELELTATSTASPDITLTVEFHGPIFFGSASDLTDVFSHPTGELGELRYRTMVLDFSNAVIYDSSGVEVIKFILREFGMERGIRVCVVSIDDRSRELLSRSHKLKRVILETFVESASMVPTEVQQAYELLTVSIEDDHGQKAGWFGRASDGRLKSEVQSLLLESTDSGSPGEDGLPVHRADNDARASSAPVISKTGSDPRRRRRDP